MSKRPLPLIMLASSCKVCGVLFGSIKDRANGGFSALCRPCYNKIKTPQHAAYVEANREWINASKGRTNKEKKELYKGMVFAAYGNICACCGLTTLEFLTLEHKKGGGRQHRIKRNYIGVYLDIIKRGYPKDDFCLLCMNCNFASREGRICPHELERRAQAIAVD